MEKVILIPKKGEVMEGKIEAMAYGGKGIVKKLTIKVMQLLTEREKAKTIFFACVEKANKSFS